MLILWFFVLLIFSHFIADFYFQTDEMAVNKSTSNRALTVHVNTYIAYLFAITVLPFCYLIHAHESWHKTGALFAFYVVNWIMHWIQDYNTSRWTTRLYKADRRHDFFVVIGFDQFLHYATLAATFSILIIGQMQ